MACLCSGGTSLALNGKVETGKAAARSPYRTEQASKTTNMTKLDTT